MEHEFNQKESYMYSYNNDITRSICSCYHAIGLGVFGKYLGVLLVIPDLFYPTFLRDIISGQIDYQERCILFYAKGILVWRYCTGQNKTG